MKAESILQMLDFYFSSITFHQKKEDLGEKKVTVHHNIDHEQNNEDNSIFRVTITTKVYDKAKQLDLKIISIGIFQITDLSIEEELKRSLITRNTVAIMFPYIRSEVSLITAQPGLMPIQIPVIDVNKLVGSKK